jgi:tetratricopeptide (TPR) repeat protein
MDYKGAKKQIRNSQPLGRRRAFRLALFAVLVLAAIMIGLKVTNVNHKRSLEAGLRVSVEIASVRSQAKSALSKGDQAQAFKGLEEALLLYQANPAFMEHPSYVTLLTEMATLIFLQKKPSPAKIFLGRELIGDAWSRSEDFDPLLRAPIALQVGLGALYAGEAKEAVTWYTKALELDPDLKGAKKVAELMADAKEWL